jgi:hypothetical protein
MKTERRSAFLGKTHKKYPENADLKTIMLIQNDFDFRKRKYGEILTYP